MSAHKWDTHLEDRLRSQAKGGEEPGTRTDYLDWALYVAELTNNFTAAVSSRFEPVRVQPQNPTCPFNAKAESSKRRKDVVPTTSRITNLLKSPKAIDFALAAMAGIWSFSVYP